MLIKHMNLHLIRSTMVAAALLAGGCEQFVENWDEVHEVPELKVHAVDYTHSVHFDPVSNEPDNLEMAQLGQFLTRIRTRREDRIEIRYENTASQRKRAAILKAVLEDQGYRPDVKRRDTEATAAPGRTEPVVVAVTKAVIKLPDCPNWSDYPGHTYNNLASSNFGCANVTNFGLMVDRPMDLIKGRGSRIFDGDLAASSIERYRSRKTTPLNVDDFGLVSEGSTSEQGGGQ